MTAAEAEEIRASILAQLPTRIRAAIALIDADDVELAAALSELTPAEQEKVRMVIMELANLPEKLLSQPRKSESSIPPDSVEAGWEDDDLVTSPAPPPQLFRIVGGQELIPPRNWRAATHRAEGDGERGSVLYPVWFATTRKPKQAGAPRNGFTGDRDISGLVHYGVARVLVPDSHTPGSVGSSWWKRWLWIWQDDRLVLRRIEGSDEATFWAELRTQLTALSEPFEGRPGPGNQVLVFVHGYNVSFAEAMVRAAQLGYDLAVPGVTACFSWPSRGTYLGYPADEAACEPAVTALADFLRRCAGLAGAGRVHVLAHSMGNRLFLRAVERLAWETRISRASDKDRFLGHLLLAAPDVDRDLFRLLAPNCPTVSARHTNLYVSSKDQAVSLSRWLHGYDRAGFHPPVTVLPGVATIDVTGADISGHSAFAEAKKVLLDITQILHYDATPNSSRRPMRFGGGGRYWQL